ncbi:hypothetical protein PR202_gb14021 [Eleusine coracana subsp. coracana]|uniref:Uncharacterized protein n=1 Tax=Eleusine coracana subsp. coracana TaxID=191504 RepID=A0AAV5ETJ8_ELECO|nr:hypothetical protein PR202_gb14021 [Eleusine coracana subsp. coracana]
MGSIAAMETVVAAAEDVKPVDFFDIDSFNLDDFDFDLAADEFCDAYAAFVADAGNKSGAEPATPGGWLAGSGIDDGYTGGGGESSESSSSPDSGVTDGPLAAEEGSMSMSAYVCELERFLLENDDIIDEAPPACPVGGEEGAVEELISVDDYFGDLMVTFDDDGGVVADADAAGTTGNADDDGKSLAAREDDQPASRKRARHKIRATTMMTCSWAELEVMRRHLAPSQVLPALWPPAAAPALCCFPAKFPSSSSSSRCQVFAHLVVEMVVVVTAEESHTVALAQQLDLKNVLCMEAGQGNASYVNNSQAQSRTFEKTAHVLKETLDKLLLLPCRPNRLLTAADLGCSCGHNTLVVADLIVQHMTDLYRSRNHPPPEFFFYFNDLPNNDFNTLFRMLPDDYHSTDDEAAKETHKRRYFGAGVPGSFHERLFPERFIDMFSSTFSLHWLSQVPSDVTDKRSAAAYNKGKVFVHGASEATGVAYKRQFQSDLARFLRCRAAELKPGGAMFLVCLGRPSFTAPTDQGAVKYLFGAMFEDSWNDLVSEGLMDGEKMDSFNVPVYAPTLEEFREVVDTDGSFRINRLELVMGSPPVVDHANDPVAVGRAVANNERSILGALVDAHVGKALGDDLFHRLQRQAEERAHELMAEMRFPHVVCSLSFKSDMN